MPQCHREHRKRRFLLVTPAPVCLPPQPTATTAPPQRASRCGRAGPALRQTVPARLSPMRIARALISPARLPVGPGPAGRTQMCLVLVRPALVSGVGMRRAPSGWTRLSTTGRARGPERGPSAPARMSQSVTTRGRPDLPRRPGLLPGGPSGIGARCELCRLRSGGSMPPTAPTTPSAVVARARAKRRDGLGCRRSIRRGRATGVFRRRPRDPQPRMPILRRFRPVNRTPLPTPACRCRRTSSQVTPSLGAVVPARR